MAININHNLFSILVQRNLDRASDQLNKAYENLSSGERINTSADDPAGMAISEGLRYQMQGLRQNQKNVTGAYNLVGTAESQLDTMINLTQNIRDLLVQGGNDTLSASDRQAIQSELSQALDELNRTASTAKFNDQYLLNGQLGGLSVQIGTRASDTLTISLPDYRTTTLGSYASKTSDRAVGTSPLTAGAVSISGSAVPASESDGISTAAADASAIAKANAINKIEAVTGVHATAQPTTFTGGGAVGAVNLNGTTNVLKINGVSIAPVSMASASDATALVSAINARTASTGVTASLDSSGALKLEAADGRNIALETQGSIGDDLGLRTGDGDVNMVLTGTVKLTATKAFSISDSSGLLGMASAQQQVGLDAATTMRSISVSDAATASASLQTVDAALAQLSAGRSSLGAISNRLDTLSDTLTSQINDLTETDSSIRETDVAYESARLTQYQIIQEAAISMLTQANVAPRRALELLQGS